MPRRDTHAQPADTPLRRRGPRESLDRHIQGSALAAHGRSPHKACRERTNPTALVAYQRCPARKRAIRATNDSLHVPSVRGILAAGRACATPRLQRRSALAGSRDPACGRAAYAIGNVCFAPLAGGTSLSRAIGCGPRTAQVRSRQRLQDRSRATADLQRTNVGLPWRAPVGTCPVVAWPAGPPLSDAAWPVACSV